MQVFEVVLMLLVAMTALVLAARKLNIPYPILLVVGGLALGFVPGLPQVEMEPELIFVIFLPPLLQSAAYFTSIRDFRANLPHIGLLAVGLPLFSMALVAIVAHMAIPGMPWGAAFVLGAIVSPPDAIAVTAVASRFSIPRHIITVLEGESLVNDATALVAYRVALAAVVSGAFSVWMAAGSFVLTGTGGVVVGLAAGWLCMELIRRLNDTPVEILLTLLAGFATYLLAEQIGVSGVLAVVTAGFYISRKSSHYLSPESRQQAMAVWSMVEFLLNGLVFIMIGLRIRTVLEALQIYDTGELLVYAMLISATVIVGRILWVWPATYGPRWLFRRLRERDPYPPWQNVALISWAGMRGIVSLAAALALPRTIESGAEFPQRALIIFLTFSVILVTLVLQGSSLAPVIRALRLQDDGGAQHEENKARLLAAKAGAARLQELVDAGGVAEWMAADLRQHYEAKRYRYSARFRGNNNGQAEEAAKLFQELRRELLQSERHAVLNLRDGGVINDEVLRRLERDLDLEEQRLGT